MRSTLLLIMTFSAAFLNAQDMKPFPSDDLPYYEVPEYPAEYNACTMAARMIDGLGFRFYWATEGLREEDLAFKPNEDARTVAETVDHIYGMTHMIANAVKQVPHTRREEGDLSFAEKRRQTLFLLKETSDKLKASKPEAIEQYKVIFERGGQRSEIPFWNLINGPIADCIWHVGQIVSFRRSSGNPLYPGISFFSGTVKK